LNLLLIKIKLILALVLILLKKIKSVLNLKELLLLKFLEQILLILAIFIILHNGNKNFSFIVKFYKY